MIRPASLLDLDALLAIENRCFDLDRLSRRSFRYMLTKANAQTLVYEDQAGIRGYVMVLFNRGTSMARLYSIAVLSELRGTGAGRRLAEAAENSALEQGCTYLRLEIRPDNEASKKLFTHLGYRQFGVHHDYYEDHMDALRFEKHLGGLLAPVLAKVPYYEQTLDFTCGPASLMMAMKTLDEGLELNRRLELRLWRESTTIFMTAGHGGCGPYGLALSAFHRGFGVEVYVNDEGALFIDSVRSEEKKEVMRLVQEDFLDEIGRVPITLSYRRLTLEEMKGKYDAGGVPLILISSYRIYKEKFPHWVVVTGYDERFIFVHDPFIDYEKGKTITDCVNMPILQQDFERMSRYGKSGQRAALVLFNRASRGAA
jgi:ribosomal protein S18 acetylase RimI-like enzyme